MPNLCRSLTIAALVLLIIGGAVTADGALVDADRVTILGLVVITIAANAGCIAWIWRILERRIAPLDDVFDKGLRVGHSRGYSEGRRATRPTVIPLRCPSCGADIYNRAV